VQVQTQQGQEAGYIQVHTDTNRTAAVFPYISSNAAAAAKAVYAATGVIESIPVFAAAAAAAAVV